MTPNANPKYDPVTDRDKSTPALIDVQAVASMLGCSSRHVYRLSDAGRMPTPVRLGSLVRWQRTSVEAWIAGGCKTVRSTTAKRGV